MNFQKFKKTNYKLIKMNDKFVYIHKKPCGEVFYVGAGSKQVINIVTGETWNTIGECAKDLNVNYSHLSEQLNNKVTNTTNLIKIKK